MTAKAVRQDTMLRWLWISLVVVFLDQITKWMAEAQIDYTTTIAKFDGVAREVIKTADYIPVFPHLNWTFAYNYGAAFNMFGGQRVFLSILAAAVSIVILVWMKKLKSTERWMAIGLAFVLGGALGNLIDRVIYGRVIDFIDVYADWDVFFLHLGSDNHWHFATFNVADIAINIGAMILIFGSLFFAEEE